MGLAASVIICTYNPRPDYLGRVLEALREQTLPLDQWELIVIDNASDQPVADEWDLRWHPLGRHVRENELGLTPARLRGIGEAVSELLVFVDDDNVLARDYLETTLSIGREWPQLGAWGGIIEGEFEREPEPWTRPLLVHLAIRQFSAPIWSNNPDDRRAQPCGAGLCVRAAVARAYVSQVAADPRRRKLDRIGSAMSSCGDTDLVLTACDLGQGFGNFPGLFLTHLIAARRAQPDYLIKLMQGIAASAIVLRFLRIGELPSPPSRVRSLLRFGLIVVRQGLPRARLYGASQVAIFNGIRAIRQLTADGQDKEGSHQSFPACGDRLNA